MPEREPLSETALPADVLDLPHVVRVCGDHTIPGVNSGLQPVAAEFTQRLEACRSIGCVSAEQVVFEGRVADEDAMLVRRTCRPNSLQNALCPPLPL
jgi:hypothetical protein